MVILLISYKFIHSNELHFDGFNWWVLWGFVIYLALVHIDAYDYDLLNRILIIMSQILYIAFVLNIYYKHNLQKLFTGIILFSMLIIFVLLSRSLVSIDVINEIISIRTNVNLHINNELSKHHYFDMKISDGKISKIRYFVFKNTGLSDLDKQTIVHGNLVASYTMTKDVLLDMIKNFRNSIDRREDRSDDMTCWAKEKCIKINNSLNFSELPRDTIDKLTVLMYLTLLENKIKSFNDNDINENLPFLGDVFGEILDLYKRYIDLSFGKTKDYCDIIDELKKYQYDEYSIDVSKFHIRNAILN